MSSLPPASVQRYHGIVEKIFFRNEDNGYSVVEFSPNYAKEKLTLVGELPDLKEGSVIDVEGNWIENPKFGRQLKVKSYLPASPKTQAGLIRYLSSGIIDGVGESIAHRIVEKFKDETLEVFEKFPEKLLAVEGIGKGRLKTIMQAWHENRVIHQIMVFLQSHPIRNSLIKKIYEEYGEESIAKIKKNPYQLIFDFDGVGFKTADGIALSLNLDRNSVERAVAGVHYVLEQSQSEGHVFLPQQDLISKAAELLQIDLNIIENAIDQLILLPRSPVVRETHDPQPIYIKRLYRAEVDAATHLYRILNADDKYRNRRDSWIRKFQENSEISSFQLSDEQHAAVETGLNCKVFILTGGPGTGKTTILNFILNTLRQFSLRIRLAAPTGRAAKRMSEATHQPAQTLHRLLEYEGIGFNRNEQNPLDADVIVVDEFSMVDIVLFAQLLKAIPDSAILFIVGDMDQLPSVGPGSVLRNLIESDLIAVAKLNQVFRQAAQSMIVYNAHLVNQGQVPLLNEPNVESDFFSIDKEDPEDCVRLIKEMVVRRIPEKYHFKWQQDIQILAPMQKGILGVENLNRVLQEALNPQGEEIPISAGQRKLRLGDKVMQTRNNYDLEVFNGDSGIVKCYDSKKHILSIIFDDRTVEYPKESADDLVLAYAITIHKSQGSEYAAVIIPIHTQHFVMLQKNLVYTAITRAKKLCVLIGNKRALNVAVKNNKIQHRFSGLTSRLKEFKIS